MPVECRCLKICAITASIKLSKSIIRKKKKKHLKIVMLANTKINVKLKRIRIKKAMSCIENNSIDSDGYMCFTVNSLIEIYSIITSSNNITLRKVNEKPLQIDKMYMNTKLIEDKLYQILD